MIFFTKYLYIIFFIFKHECSFLFSLFSFFFNISFLQQKIRCLSFENFSRNEWNANVLDVYVYFIDFTYHKVPTATLLVPDRFIAKMLCQQGAYHAVKQLTEILYDPAGFSKIDVTYDCTFKH